MSKVFNPAKVRAISPTNGGRIRGNTPMNGSLTAIRSTVQELVNTGQTLGSLSNYPENWEEPHQGYFYPALQVANGEITGGLDRLELTPGNSGISAILLLHGFRTNANGEAVNKAGAIVEDEAAYITQSFNGIDVDHILSNELWGQPIPIIARMLAREGRAPIQTVALDYSRMTGKNAAPSTHPLLVGQSAPTIEAFNAKLLAYRAVRGEPSEAILKAIAESAIAGV